MMHIVKSASGAWPLLVLALAVAGCDAAGPTEPVTSVDATPEVSSVAPSFASSFRGGIPFGVFHLPKEEYGTTYNGSLASISPTYLLSYLEAARRSGTRIMLNFSGGQKNFRNADFSFSLTKWKERLDRYRGIDFSSYIKDGTIMGHYLVDEPNDKSNWGGTTISQATLDEMARYSKQLWPAIPTIVRTSSAYLKGGTYRHLDAAWAQYHQRFGSVEPWISNSVRDAKASGLALVVGVNHLAGGTSSGGLRGYYTIDYAMSASELESWGGALLKNPDVCAFLSWRYDERYMGRPDIKAVMGRLSELARNHGSKSCRGTNGQTSGAAPQPPAEEPPPVVDPKPVPPVEEPKPVPPVVDPKPAPTGISLSVTGWLQENRHHMRLTWSGASGSTVDLYRNGARVRSTENDRKYINTLRYRGAATYAYKVCEKGTSRCSNEVKVALR
jgi:hypothetical protein